MTVNLSGLQGVTSTVQGIAIDGIQFKPMKMALLKKASTSENKEAKQSLILDKIDQLCNIALSNQAKEIRGKLLESYDVSVKIMGSQRIKLSLKCYGDFKEYCLEDVESAVSFGVPAARFVYGDQKDIGKGKLTIDGQEYILNGPGTIESVKVFNADRGFGSIVNGNGYEFTNFHYHPVNSDSFWTNWKHGELKWRYQNEVYPYCIAYLNALLKPEDAVLEICSGDGNLAELVLENNGSKISKYYSIERNKKSSESAESRLAQWIEEGKVEVVREDITTIDYSKVVKSQVDVVLGSGALTREVLESREYALKALDRALRVLKPGGYALFTGIAIPLITAQDLEERGLSILNKHNPFKELHLYLAQKKTVFSLD